MNETELKNRTKKFALRVIRLVESLPHSNTANVIGRQLLRSATSVGANYRSACMGRSRADFAAKIGIALEEADEAAYWMELIIDAGLVPEDRMTELLSEAKEIVSILVASLKTTRRNTGKE
ncbi:MAG TPA: four helix bundle protein [Anaerolineaceae bacterium]|jgi:four helix bundle protein|nr:four helix bundle protein [Anaerolineaceae bacterium]